MHAAILEIPLPRYLIFILLDILIKVVYSLVCYEGFGGLWSL